MLFPPSARLPFRATMVAALMASTISFGQTGPAPNRPGERPKGSVVQFRGRKREANAWPQWRGPLRDAVSLEKNLLGAWPEGGPKLAWTHADCGVGFSGPAIQGGKLYLMGGKEGKTFVFSLDARSGERLWTTSLDEILVNDWGDGPRGTPTVDGNRLFGITGRGTLACLDAKSGKLLWSRELVKEFEGTLPNWGYTESPLALPDKVLATPGGKNCIVAFDKRTGETIWTSTGLDDAAHYASLVPLAVDGVAMVATMTARGLVGVSAENGRFLWRYEKTANGTAVIPTPVVRDRYVYSTSGYGTGCGLVALSVSGGEVQAEEVYFSKEMKNQHGGVLLKGDHVYGYSDGGGWLCQDFMTGAVVWRERGLGKGSIVYGDERIYCYTEAEGAVVLADASPEGWKERGRFTIPKTTNLPRKSGQIWTHPVIAEGKLFLRDQEFLFAYEITER